MITSNRCWLKDTCKKYNDLSKECDCRYNDTFCIKLFKLDILYEKSLLTENQRKRVKFVLDANKSDREEILSLFESLDKCNKKLYRSTYLDYSNIQYANIIITL